MFERAPSSHSTAQSLVEVAETHLAPALAQTEADTVPAYDALHGANRQAITAILPAQGVRPTHPGS